MDVPQSPHCIHVSLDINNASVSSGVWTTSKTIIKLPWKRKSKARCQGEAYCLCSDNRMESHTKQSAWREPNYRKREREKIETEKNWGKKREKERDETRGKERDHNFTLHLCLKRKACYIFSGQQHLHYKYITVGMSISGYSKCELGSVCEKAFVCVYMCTLISWTLDWIGNTQALREGQEQCWMG